MTTYSWTPGVSADWNSAVDWAPFGVPNAPTDDAVMAAPGNYTVKIGVTESFTVDTLTFNPGAGGALAVNGTLTLSGALAEMTESSGTVNIAGTLSGGTLTLDGGTLDVESSGKMTISATSASAGNFGLHNGGVVDFSGDFANSGTLAVDNVYTIYEGGVSYAEGGSRLTIGGTLINTGTVQIGNTYLSAATTVILGGLVNASGASFALRGGSYAATLAFSGAGSGFTSNGGNFELTYATPLTLSSSFINTGTFGLHDYTALTISGDFTNSGTLAVDNVYTIYEGGVNYAEGGSKLTIGGTLTNTGTVQIGNTYLSAATTVILGGLVNASGASFALRGGSYAATLAFSGAGSGFTSNGGNFELTYATPLTLSNSFINTGTFGLHDYTALTISGDFTNSGTLAVDNVYTIYEGGVNYAEGGSKLTIGGTLTNTGTVQIGNTYLSAATTVILGGLVNASGASFALRGGSYAATLAFSGAGSGFTSNGGNFELTYATPLTLSSSFINTGTFGLHDYTALTISGDFTNSGTLAVDNVYTIYEGGVNYAEGGSKLTIGGTLTNTGTVQIGNTYLSAATTVILGGLVNASGASFALRGGSYAATLAVAGPASNSGIINIGGYSVLDVTGANAFTQTAGTTTVNGTLTAATIDIDGGALIVDTVADANAFTQTGGTATINGTLNAATVDIDGGSLTVNGTLTAATIDIDGGTLIVDTTNFTNTGTLMAAGGGVINFSAGGLTNLSGATLTGGTYVVDTGSILQLPNNALIVTLAADLTLSGTGSIVESLDTTTHVQVPLERTLTTIAAGGALSVLGDRSYTTANTIADAGALQIGGGGTFTAAGLSVAAGAMVSVGAGSSLDLASPLIVDGTLTNAGTINGGGATAVTFGSGTDRLILDPGATFVGTVVGGGADTTLELAQGSGSGTLDALGTTFTNFGTVIVDTGATWTVEALASALAGTSITGSGGSNVLEIISAGTFSLGGVSNFPAIDLASGNNNVTVTDTTLAGGSVVLRDGASGSNTVTVSDTAASTGKSLAYVAGPGNDTFAGGFENDSVTVSATAVGGDTLTGGSGTNTLVLAGAGTFSLGGVSNFATIDLAAGNNIVTVTDKTLSGGPVTINDGASGNNNISAAGDTAVSTGKSLTYMTGAGSDIFTGGFENDTVYVSATAVGGDTLTGGSGSNSLVLTSAGSVNLGRVSHFTTINLAAGTNTVYVSAAAVSGDVLIGGSGTNTLVLTTAGLVNLGGVSGFGNIDLFAGTNTVTVGDATLRGGPVALRAGASGNNTVTVSDTAASTGKSLAYVAGPGNDTFAGGFENDTVYVSAAAVGGDTLAGGSSRTNALVLTSAGAFSLSGVRNFANIDLLAGNNTVTVTDTTLSGGPVALRAGASGTNMVTVSDTTASTGKSLAYVAGPGTDSFTGGFENDTVYVSAAAVGGDTLTGGSGSNSLVLTSAGSVNLGRVSHFTTINLAAGTNTVYVSAAAVSGDVLIGGSGTNTLVLTTAGLVNLGGVSGFGNIDLFAGTNTVTVGDATLRGGPVALRAGASSSNTVTVSDTAASTGKSLAYVAGPGNDTFAGGFENDTVYVSAAAVGGDTLAGGSSRTNALVLTSAGAFSLSGVRNFANIDLLAGNNTVTVTDTTLSGGPVALRAGASGTNMVTVSDTTASTGKSLAYVAGPGNDTFAGGSENDTVYVSAAAVGGDTLTGGSGSNALVLTSAGTVNLRGVSGFANIDLFAGNNTVTVSNTTLAGGAVAIRAGASGSNSVSAAGDTALSTGKSLAYVAGAGSDGFTGGFENDTIYAGTGLGTFTAGSGADMFVFTADNLPNQALENFQAGADHLDVYGIHATNGFDLGPTDNGLNPGAPTLIDPSIFIANASGDFTSASQRFAYDTSDGHLLYSASGSNASATLVATLVGAPAFTASNLLFQH